MSKAVDQKKFRKIIARNVEGGGAVSAPPPPPRGLLGLTEMSSYSI